MTRVRSAIVWCGLVIAALAFVKIFLYLTIPNRDVGQQDIGDESVFEGVARQFFSPVSGDVRLPDKYLMDKLNHSQAAALYHSFVDNLQTFCPHMERMGKANDGGWEVCVDAKHKPKKPCLIYSFGINNDFSFDDDIQKKLGCTIHCFDPSMGIKDHIRAPNIYFHSMGLAHYNGTSEKNWQMRTLTAIREKLGHLTIPIDILKMDIEGMEWEVVPEMLDSGFLDDVKQFVLEVHVMPVGLIIKPDPSRERYVTGLKVLKDLHDNGFRSFFSHRNPGCTFRSKFGMERIGCNEIYMLNMRYS